MKYKSGFKIEFRVLPLSLSPPLLKYTLPVTSRRHQSIRKCCVVCCIFGWKKNEKKKKKKEEEEKRQKAAKKKASGV